ncbi:MAG TPA: 4-hydroxythreonine-4-phosphate dehydrogenase PdxA [Flavobacteriales bacterium]|nr:4-hydroxythreonine-4-phosphate dehydrogenase PdxA [Flavobacteriales bacterium]|tara:strand:+ start:8252 stop:9301 length:1050 start_codon:yes stop_codon:yes gene_type:complete
MNVTKNKVKVGITIGDINGIGLEVIIKTFSNHDMFEFCTPIVYGSSKIASYHRKALNINDFSFFRINNVEDANPKKANIINCWSEEVPVNLGEQTPEGGKYALKSLQAAVKDLKEGKIDVLVTAPINKKNIQSDEFEFPGHTEYLEKELGGKALMLMVSENLKVGVVTGHIPLKDVAQKVTKEALKEKLEILINSLKNDFIIEKPKIAVLGLNPHAGDKGTIGTEELEIINPVLEEMNTKKAIVLGPYSADGFFGSGNYKNFDAVLAMYHDQGLIPFKSLSFGQGVNYTAGLPFVRTSPDHGTAYDIAGKSVADESSFRAAIFAAIDIFRNRKNEKQLQENKLEPAKTR